MLVLIGTLVICGLLAAILFNRLSPIAALILMPVAGALAAGFGLQTAKFMVAGISEIAPVAGMFVFAILFFGVMTDAGLLEPLLRRITRLAGSRPSLIVPSHGAAGAAGASGWVRRGMLPGRDPRHAALV